MHFAKPMLAAILIALFCVSCATTSANVDYNDPDYQQGLSEGKAMAEKDKGGIVCSTKSRFQATQAAKKQTKILREQGKSEAFVAGFYRAYKDVYEMAVADRCND